jgi:hypothetical protein
LELEVFVEKATLGSQGNPLSRRTQLNLLLC